MKLQTERLATLAAFLKTVPKENFDMGTWCAASYDDEEKAKKTGALPRKCGSAACALGWAPSIPAFRKAGFKLSSDGWGLIPSYKDKEDIEAGMEFFGLSNRLALHFFGGDDYDYDEDTGDIKATGKDVAKRIEKFLKDPYDYMTELDLQNDDNY